MATVTLTIPTAVVNRVVHALCKSYGYQVENAGNAKKAIIDHIRATVRNVEQSEAEQAALAALVEPDTEGVVT
jgi:hypothetical protein